MGGDDDGDEADETNDGGERVVDGAEGRNDGLPPMAVEEDVGESGDCEAQDKDYSWSVHWLLRETSGCRGFSHYGKLMR